MKGKFDRFNIPKSNWLLRKRTDENKINQEWKIKFHKTWKIGNGRYYLLKW